MKSQFVSQQYEECDLSEEILGSGVFGEVIKCKGKDFVLKKSKPHKSSDDTEIPTLFKGEYDYILDLSIPEDMKYEYVVKMFPVYEDGSYNMEKIVMEKVFPLDDFLDQNYPLTNPVNPKSMIFRRNTALKLVQLVKALHHEMNYSHNDLKPANIGFRIKEDGRKQLILLDMGTSMKFNKTDMDRWFHIDDTNIDLYSKIIPFSPEYANPGIFGEFYHNHIHRDNWAVACTIYKILTGESIYGSRTLPQLSKVIFTFNPEKFRMFFDSIKGNVPGFENILLNLMLPSVEAYANLSRGGGRKNIKSGGSPPSSISSVSHSDPGFDFKPLRKTFTLYKDGTMIIHDIKRWKQGVMSYPNVIFKKDIKPDGYKRTMDFIIDEPSINTTSSLSPLRFSGGANVNDNKRVKITKKEYDLLKSKKKIDNVSVRKFRTHNNEKDKYSYVYYKYAK